MKSYFVIFLSLLIVASCQNKNRPPLIIERDIDLGDTHVRHFNAALESLTNKLNLKSLKNGIDSFEVRIWCPQTNDILDLIAIAYVGKSWKISQTRIWQLYRDYQYKRNDTTYYMAQVVVDSTKM